MRRRQAADAASTATNTSCMRVVGRAGVPSAPVSYTAYTTGRAGAPGTSVSMRCTSSAASSASTGCSARRSCVSRYAYHQHDLGAVCRRAPDVEGVVAALREPGPRTSIACSGYKSANAAASSAADVHPMLAMARFDRSCAMCSARGGCELHELRISACTSVSPSRAHHGEHTLSSAAAQGRTSLSASETARALGTAGTRVRSPTGCRRLIPATLRGTRSMRRQRGGVVGRSARLHRPSAAR